MAKHPGNLHADYIELLAFDEDDRQARLELIAEEDPEGAEQLRMHLEMAARERAADKASGTFQPWLADPEIIGPYRLLDRVGEGGMGIVYLAEQKLPVRRRVAIKVIQPGMASPTVIRRFEAERQALAMMNHPGIAGILDGGETKNGLPYFVMEFVQGTPLLRYCDSHRLDIRQRLQLLRRIALAVQHAHQKGVIHRDLKPSNILVTEGDGEPQPKIIDFGVAKALFQPLTSSTLHTRSGAIIGTPEYMSPEQCASSNVDVDTRSDVYALGALMYHLFSGFPPHDFGDDEVGRSALEILKRVAEEEPVPVSRRVRDADEAMALNRGFSTPTALQRYIAGELDWIAARAIARDRNERYESAQAFADDIHRYLEHEPVSARPPSLPYLAGKLLRRHIIAATVVAMTFIFLGTSSLLMFWQVKETEAERDRANRQAANAREVTRFTTSLFDLASPRGGNKADVSARELLDTGVRYLDSQEIADGRLRAALLEAAGSAYLGLGIYDAARPLLEEAVSLHEKTDSGSPEHVRALTKLSYWHGATSNFQEAEKLATTAMLLDDTLATRTALASALRQEGRFDEAAVLLEEHVDGRASAERAAALIELGKTRFEQGRLDDADALVSKASRHYQSLQSAPSTYSVEALSALAEIHSLQGDFVLAIEEFSRAVADAEKIYGPEHSAIGILLNRFGAALYLSRDPQHLVKAEQMYTRARLILEEKLGPAHAELADLYHNIGNLFIKMQKAGESLPVLQLALQTRTDILGETHPDTLTTQLSLGIALAETAQYDTAVNMLIRVHSLLEDKLGKVHWRTANAEYFLARTLFADKRLDEALAHADAAARTLERTLGPTNSRTRNAHSLLREISAVRQREPGS